MSALQPVAPTYWHWTERLLLITVSLQQLKHTVGLFAGTSMTGKYLKWLQTLLAIFCYLLWLRVYWSYFQILVVNCSNLTVGLFINCSQLGANWRHLYWLAYTLSDWQTCFASLLYFANRTTFFRHLGLSLIAIQMVDDARPRTTAIAEIEML